MVSLLSELAVISKKAISSAPSSLYLFATSTGAPASRSDLKLIPLTTLPLLTSRQGIILLVRDLGKYSKLSERIDSILKNLSEDLSDKGFKKEHKESILQHISRYINKK